MNLNCCFECKKIKLQKLNLILPLFSIFKHVWHLFIYRYLVFKYIFFKNLKFDWTHIGESRKTGRKHSMYSNSQRFHPSHLLPPELSTVCWSGLSYRLNHRHNMNSQRVAILTLSQATGQNRSDTKFSTLRTSTTLVTGSRILYANFVLIDQL